MKLLLVIFTSITVLILGFRLLIIREKKKVIHRLNPNWDFDKMNDEIEQRSKLKKIELNTNPDNPIPFGYKSCWFAVKTNNTDLLVKTLGLQNLSQANWHSGIECAYGDSNYVYITPPIGKWKLIVGTSLNFGDSDEGIEEVTQILNKLSKVFGEAQFFGTHRVVEFHCWAKSVDGELKRYYSYLGERGENLKVYGEISEIENSINLINTFSERAKDEFYLDDESLVFPSEELVMKIAGDWSVNPSLLEEYFINKTELGAIVSWSY